MLDSVQACDLSQPKSLSKRPGTFRFLTYLYSQFREGVREGLWLKHLKFGCRFPTAKEECITYSLDVSFEQLILRSGSCNIGIVLSKYGVKFVETYDKESSAYYSKARLWDDEMA
ncbi:unnamed protein product [Lactuca virosa]|uniref:Uncharacterized protein n=1 Tax=Lactuca virosa TaxID=75947 RepID=A0AAU9NNA6_9ASTR|nr:unnamed protein product [Lactuca virosa]